MEDSFESVYFSYIQFYLKYAHIAWVSSYATKLKRVYLKENMHCIQQRQTNSYSKVSVH